MLYIFIDIHLFCLPLSLFVNYTSLLIEDKHMIKHAYSNLEIFVALELNNHLVTPELGVSL